MSNKNYADLVVKGKVYTANRNAKYAQAFAVRDGKFVCVGSEEEVSSYIEPGKTKIIEHKKGIIIPGGYEGHAHYFMKEPILLIGEVRGKSGKEVVENFCKVYESNPNRSSYFSMGWEIVHMRDELEKLDFASMLDEVCEDRPVVLIDENGHFVLANTKALEISGLLYDGTVKGGTIGRDENGKARGFLSDQAAYYIVKNVIDYELPEEISELAVRKAQKVLHQRGYTGLFDAWSNFCGTRIFYAAKKLDDAGQLKANIAASYKIDPFMDKDEELRTAQKLKDECSSKHFIPDTIKIFIDGSAVEALTGWMIDPYPETKNNGTIIWNEEALKEIVKKVNSAGFKVHTHCYGDGAARAFINAVAESTDQGYTHCRNTAGHARNVRQEDMKRAKKYDIAFAENIAWHVSGGPETDAALSEAIGKVPYESGYPIRSFLKEGIKVSSSTDSPIESEIRDYSVWGVIEVAVTGINTKEELVRPFGIDELVTIEDAVDCLTINGAWQMGLDADRGSIETGKSADFVFGDTDIFNCPVFEIRKTKTEKVFFEGEEVYSCED